MVAIDRNVEIVRRLNALCQRIMPEQQSGNQSNNRYMTGV
jgi:hypothetical protein